MGENKRKRDGYEWRLLVLSGITGVSGWKLVCKTILASSANKNDPEQNLIKMLRDKDKDVPFIYKE